MNDDLKDLYNHSLELKSRWFKTFKHNTNQSQLEFNEICKIDNDIKMILIDNGFTCVNINSSAEESKKQDWYDEYNDIVGEKLFILVTTGKNHIITEFWFGDKHTAMDFKLRYFMCLI